MDLEFKLRKIPKNSTGVKTHKKSGRYLKSVFPQVDGYGESRWVVGCYVEIDYPSLLREMSEDELLRLCLEQLNEIPPRKRFERRPTSSLYGSLEILSYKLRGNSENPFIEMLLITDEQKNDNFWGEGISYVGSQKARRRSRKTKDIFA